MNKPNSEYKKYYKENSGDFIISDFKYGIYYLKDENYKCIAILQNPFRVIEFTDFATEVIPIDQTKWISIYKNSCRFRKNVFGKFTGKFTGVIYHNALSENPIRSENSWIKSSDIESFQSFQSSQSSQSS